MAVDSEHSVEILCEIFENGIQSDLITLTAGVGGQRIPIHRLVLTANSRYFTALLGPSFREADESEFILDGIDGSTLKAIIDFCYTGRITLTEENVSKYLAIASGIELRMLERKCFRFFADKLNINNAVAIMFIAEKFNGYALRHKALDLICQLFEKIPPPNIDELDNRSLVEILKSDAVHAEEQLIFERVLSWYRKDQDERGQHMNEILKLIRLPSIPFQYLIGDKVQMIYKEFDCEELLHVEHEHRQRIACPTSNAGIRRYRSIYCLFKQPFCSAGARQSGVKIERYISVSNEFERVGEIDLEQLRHFGAVLNENKVYILGGQIGNVDQKSVSVFNLFSGEKRVLPEMASARSDFASILVGKFIYVFGGAGPFNRQMTSCERFDLETETWETLKPMNVARTGGAVAVLNGLIYVAGGRDCSLWDCLNDVELFDPQNGEWITLSPMQRVRHFAICSSNGCLYAFGDKPLIEKYDPMTALWTKIGSFKLCEVITSAVAVNDNIYVITKDGDFGEIKIDENNGCSFTPFAKSKFSAEYRFRQVLFYN